MYTELNEAKTTLIFSRAMHYYTPIKKLNVA
jgi:hypothetical protein